MQAFDSDGTAVVGTMMAVRHAGTGQAARFHPGVSTIGGLASAQLPTWDFGSQGAGMLAAICGATDPGILDLEFAFDDGSSSGVNWDPLANFDFELPYSIPVVATATVDDADGFASASLAAHSAPANLNSLFDNCIFTANPSQANGDGNFIDNGPNYAMDDATNPVSDSTGNACDGNHDNDGLLDADEIAGSDCAGIFTDPLDPDTDGDGALDGAECLRGTSPTDAVVEASCNGVRSSRTSTATRTSMATACATTSSAATIGTIGRLVRYRRRRRLRRLRSRLPQRRHRRQLRGPAPDRHRTPPYPQHGHASASRTSTSTATGGSTPSTSSLMAHVMRDNGSCVVDAPD